MIGLVACSAEKLDRAAPAREVYASQLFRKALRYAEAWCERSYVLSALHGVLELERVIEPYDVRLRTRAEALAWAQGAAGELALLHGPRAELLILAGDLYTAPLVNELVDVYGFARGNIYTPLDRLDVGHRLAVLTHGLSRAPRELGQFVARRPQEVNIG